jgi:hypothetical protein
VNWVAEALTFNAFYTTAGEGTAGLTVTVDIYDPDHTKIVNGASATAVGGGWYYYVLAATSITMEGTYNAQFKTSDGSVDAMHLPSEKTAKFRPAYPVNTGWGYDTGGRASLT